MSNQTSDNNKRVHLKKSEHYQSESKTTKRSLKRVLLYYKFRTEWFLLCF